MNRIDRSRVATALVLILLGVWFLLVQFVPALEGFAINDRTWPLIIIGLGILFALIGLVMWTPAFLVPACVIGGIGGLLFYQNSTGDWKSWAYAWTLIPGFVGVGVFLSSLLSGRIREAIRAASGSSSSAVRCSSSSGRFSGGPACSVYTGRYPSYYSASFCCSNRSSEVVVNFAAQGWLTA